MMLEYVKSNKRAAETTADELKANSYTTPQSLDSSARNVRQHIDRASSLSPPSPSLIEPASSSAAAAASSAPRRQELKGRGDLTRAGTYITAADIARYPVMQQSRLQENLLEIWNKLLDLPHFRETFQFVMRLISFSTNISLYVPEITISIPGTVPSSMTVLMIYFTGPTDGICEYANIVKLEVVGNQSSRQTAWLPDAQAALFTILNILKTNGFVKNKFYETHASAFQLNIIDGQMPIPVKRDVSELSIDELKQELARREIFENEKKRCDTFKQDMQVNTSYLKIVIGARDLIKPLTDSEIPTDVRVIDGKPEIYEQIILTKYAKCNEAALAEIYADWLKKFNVTREHICKLINCLTGSCINKNYRTTIKQQGATLVAETETEIDTALNLLRHMENCVVHNNNLAGLIIVKQTLRALRARGSGTVADVIQKKKDVPASKSSQEGSPQIEASASAAIASDEIPAPMEITKEPTNEESI
jgi:hypothetical protein